jgi:hypothetical protein
LEVIGSMNNMVGKKLLVQFGTIALICAKLPSAVIITAFTPTV